MSLEQSTVNPFQTIMLYSVHLYSIMLCLGAWSLIYETEVTVGSLFTG